MKIVITNRQKIGRPNIPRIRRLTLFFMDQVQQKKTRQCWGDLSLVLIDDVGIVRINRLYLDREEVTDVISFELPSLPQAGLPGRPSGVRGGELFVNVQRAQEVGRGAVDRELALYIAHACDHLSGASDRSSLGRRRMRTRELGWLRAAKKKRLLHGLLEIR